VLAPSLRDVPTPANLIASQGTDASTTIYQPSTDTYWDFWRASEDASGHWSACWGGKIEHYSRNRGIFANPLGTTATGLPLGAFTIRIAELQRGYIDHAINLVVPRTQANCFSWPATRDDGNTPGSDLPCEGQRFRLNPSFDVSTLYGPAAQIIARAMQKYGLILTDKGGAVVTYAEDPRPYEATHGGVNPYPALMDPDDLPPSPSCRPSRSTTASPPGRRTGRSSPPELAPNHLSPSPLHHCIAIMNGGRSCHDLPKGAPPAR
jgi:hypothetical protein